MVREDTAESAAWAVAKERLDRLKDEIRQITQRLDSFADGAIEKIKGDAQLATQVQQTKELVGALDVLLVRGEAGSPSIKSEVENLRREVNALSREVKSLSSTVQGHQREDAAVQVAQITGRSSNWKTTALLIGTALTSLTSLIVALLT